jgi:hypothetical protein
MKADVNVGGYIHTHNLESDYIHTFDRGELIGEVRGHEKGGSLEA